MKASLGLFLIGVFVTGLCEAKGIENSSKEDDISAAVKHSFEILEDDLAFNRSIDFRIQAGLLLLPYRPREASFAIVKTLQTGRASAQLTDSTADYLASYLSPRLLRYTRRAMKNTLPPRWALRLVSYEGAPKDLKAMERYLLSPVADPGMIPLLASYGDDAIPLLERLLHRSYEESCRAALLITELGDTVHYDEMEDYGKNNLCLAWNLARLQPERARPLMWAHLLSKNPMVRRQAVHSLGSIGDSSYLPLLHELISDTDAVVRSNAAFALGFFGDTSGAGILRKAAADTESIAGQNAERLLSQLPEALIEPVLHSLLSSDYGAATQRAAKAAGQLRDSTSVPYLLELLKTENQNLQLLVLDALGEIGVADAREPVRFFLNSEDMKLKVGAILASGALKDTSVVGRLNLMLFWEVGPWNESNWVRHPIVDALAMIGDTSALPALALALDDGDPYLGVKVLSFFRKHASSDYIPYVEPFLESSTAPVRIEAAAAIIAMAERHGPG